MDYAGQHNSVHNTWRWHHVAFWRWLGWRHSLLHADGALVRYVESTEVAMEDIPWDAAAEAKQAVGEQERTAWKHQTVEEYLAHIDIELHVVILCPHAQSCANVLLEPFTR